MKEFGGFFGLDLAGGREYYHENVGYDLLRLNSARYGILLSLQDMGLRKICLPHYLCESVREALTKAGMDCVYYPIDSDMRPQLENLPEDAAILITDFFGLLPEDTCKALTVRYERIIFDFTQSFFRKPILQENVYCVYSPRKFVGVTDGAYVITRIFRKGHIFPQDNSYNRVITLSKALELSTNDAYADSLQAEREITEAGCREMSKTTQALLDNVDYDSVRESRARNFNYLHAKLGGRNGWKIPAIKADGQRMFPMIYPLFLPDRGDDFRKRLVEKKIYVPQWWKYLLNEAETSDWERALTKHLFPLPIDQRYSLKDMDELADIVLNLMDEG